MCDARLLIPLILEFSSKQTRYRCTHLMLARSWLVSKHDSLMQSYLLLLSFFHRKMIYQTLHSLSTLEYYNCKSVHIYLYLVTLQVLPNFLVTIWWSWLGTLSANEEPDESGLKKEGTSHEIDSGCSNVGCCICYCLVKEDCRKDEHHEEEPNGEEEALFCTLCNAEVWHLIKVYLLFKRLGNYVLVLVRDEWWRCVDYFLWLAVTNFRFSWM